MPARRDDRTKDMLRQDRPNWILLITVAAIGLNLRPFLTSIGPLVEDISVATGLGSYGIASLTFVPMALMGCLAFLGPALQRLAGARRVLITALVIVCIGTLSRLFVTSAWVMVASAAVTGLGVAIVQAIFPGVIKQLFPGRVAFVMGLYSAMLLGGGAIGAQILPMIAERTGDWRIGLGSLAILGVLAVPLVWFALPGGNVPAPERNIVGTLLGRPRTWLLMVFFGLANGGYSSVVAWLASYYREHGWTASASGSLLAIMAICQAFAALAVPMLASRTGRDHRPWLWLTLACQFIGFSGFALAPDAAPFLFVVLTGMGFGGCFALSLVVTLDHFSDPARAGALSALVQGGGFLLTALPPLIVSSLHDLTGGFEAGWKWHMGAIAVAAILSVRFSPKRYDRSWQCP